VGGCAASDVRPPTGSEADRQQFHCVGSGALPHERLELWTARATLHTDSCSRHQNVLNAVISVSGVCMARCTSHRQLQDGDVGTRMY
jgi:hypothetical protein